MRKSIFDIVSETIDMEGELKRIVSMSQKEKVLYNGGSDYTLFDFVNDRCFRKWKYRGHFVDVKDYLLALEYSDLIDEAKYDEESFITLIELVYNFWVLAYKDLCDEKTSTKWQNNFYHLRDVMLDNLEKYNHKAYFDNDRVLIVEDKPEVTAVVEIVEPGLTIDIIQYNHRSLEGEIELKKAILLKLANELEPKRAEIEAINKQLASDIFFMLNNMNIRHNNRSKKDKNYKEYVAKMKKERLEKWYDELYQMMLLAILLLDNADRINKINELKTKICGG